MAKEKKYRRVSCHNCGVMDEQPNMIRTSVTKHSGSSLGMSGLFDNNKRSSARVYTRKRDIWLCPDCHTKKTSKSILWILVLAGLFYWLFFSSNS